MKRLLTCGTLLTCLIMLTNCQAQNCNTEDLQFSNYEEAVEKVRQIDFNISEKLQTEDSSWIAQIEYYSCDKETGFLVMTTKKGRIYIHRDVPLTLWNRFKNASSFGKFYNSTIKGNYQF